MADKKMIYLDDAIDALAYFTEKSPTGRTAQEVVKDLPPAQPEERTEERTETHACDCISRQAAIDDLRGKDPSQIWDTADVEVWINELPSAQPSGKDPIEREAVVDILHDAMQGCSESEEDLIGDIVSKVDLLPSAQPEIIRCEDCKYWREHKYTPYCGFNAIYTKADDFCSRAERREE